MAKLVKMALIAIMEWPKIWPLLVSMERAGKIQITHENGIEKLQRFKSYGQIKIFTEIRAKFLCNFPQNFNELEGPLRMLGFV